MGAGFLDKLISWKWDALFDQQFPYYSVQGLFFCHQFIWLSALPCSIALYHYSTDAVDGAKGESFCVRLTKETDKASFHVSCSRYGIGHSEDILRRDFAAADHIAQSCDQYRSLSAARNCQQQYRSLCLFYGHTLLRIQAGEVFGFKFL